jgi:general secretion pathway protein J
VRTRSGFTLAEVLIALVIFALLAAAGTAVMAAAVDGRFAVKAADARTAELQRLRALLKADVGQTVSRSDPTVSPIQTGDGVMLGLIRTGWANPAGRARPSLQRVEWRVVEGRLERRVADQVTGAALGPAQVVAREVSDVRVSFVSLEVETPVFTPRPPMQMAPDAVRVRMTLKDVGPVELLLLVGWDR